jgi:enoyl-CoA hydratase/carnithine racemase
MSDPVVLRGRRGAVYWISINRPQKRNSLNAQVIAEIVNGFEAAHADPDVRAIVLTGEGDKAFCAGADLDPGQNFATDPSRPTLDYADMARLARRATLPVIARVNGACVAGGMGLLGMADIAIAADHARFGLPEVRVGLFPMQVIAILQPLVPARLLREWCLTGELFGADVARSAGLLNAVVPAAELDAKLASLIDSIKAGSPGAMRRGLYAFHTMEDMPFPQSIAFAEGQITLAARTEDAREGLAAFNEKRPPSWSGK